MSDVLSRWAGLALCAVGLIATLALAVTGDLTLYIHPRYVLFTVVLSVLGAGLFLASVWYAASGGRGGTEDGHDHTHEHDHAHEHQNEHPHDHGADGPGGPAQRHPSPLWRTVRGRVSATGLAALVVAATVALLVVPPATLSAERALTTATAADGGGDVPRPALLGSDPTGFSVRDWATILGGGATADDLVGQQADITAFVLVSEDGSARLGRYAVTCCTVDAQLFAVPVVAADLPDGLAFGSWVRVTGTFADVAGATLLHPDAVEVVEEPDDPYLS
ncbi:MAG: hypothetical protein FJW64_07985 [Actinobacteria bacterium]|nr:hypothetical protein [Actinomycetota bacterium]